MLSSYTRRSAVVGNKGTRMGARPSIQNAAFASGVGGYPLSSAALPNLSRCVAAPAARSHLLRSCTYARRAPFVSGADGRYRLRSPAVGCRLPHQSEFLWLSSPGPGIRIISRIGAGMKHAGFRIDDDHCHFAHRPGTIHSQLMPLGDQRLLHFLANT